MEFSLNETTLFNGKHPPGLQSCVYLLFCFLAAFWPVCLPIQPARALQGLPANASCPPPSPPLLSTRGRVGEARQKSHSGCAVIASVYHQPEDFYYCRWMMGLASCRPGRAGSFQSGLKCTPHCTEASRRGTTNRMGGFGESALK